MLTAVSLQLPNPVSVHSPLPVTVKLSPSLPVRTAAPDVTVVVVTGASVVVSLSSPFFLVQETSVIAITAAITMPVTLIHVVFIFNLRCIDFPGFSCFINIP